MKRLLIDIGNTRIKGCIANDLHIGKVVSKIYDKLDITKEYTDFLAQFKPKGKITRNSSTFKTVYITVADKSLYAKLIFLTKEYETVLINTKTELPVKIDYSDSLGSDRICSAVGAYTKYSEKKNLLVIDFGTATTLNIITKGVYKGGMISTGIKTSADALMKRTTLPKVFLTSNVKLINNETEGAIVSGIVFQQVLFIQKAIEEYRKLFKDLYVIATGGGSEIIMKHKTGIDKFEPNLVLEGLNHIAIYNETIRKKQE
jgi:type III pantothenate kinase